MKVYTLEQEKARLENVAYAENAVKACTRRHRIRDYIPGQATYNLGGYPSKFSIMPTEYDEECIKNLAEMGVGLIQVHEEWNDSIRVLGADKYSSHDPEGMRVFVDLCHRYGIKIVPYVSTGYIDARDPDCREDFFLKTEEDLRLEQVHFRYRLACPQSASWRQFILGKMENILDNYGFDGLYNDYGYARAEFHRRWCIENGVKFREDHLPYDPYAEDMLSRAYDLCHKRGGVMKMHIAGNRRITSSEKLYDYLWVGEGIEDPSTMLMTVPYEPYIVPCPDYKCVTDENFEDFFAQSLPFMQFPLRLDGRPLTDAKVKAPGIEYAPNPLTDFYRDVAKYVEKHPDGPYVYSEWSAIPDNVQLRKRWAEYLKLYLPLVEEDNICHQNITETTLVKGLIPENVYMSLFSGCRQFLCVSNLGNAPQALALEDVWKDCESGVSGSEFLLQPRRVRFLERIVRP